MAPTLVAFFSTLVACCVLAFLTPLRPFVPFPKLDPNPLPAEVSAAVAEARDQWQTADKGQRKAEGEAATHFGTVARLTVENGGLRERIRKADAKIATLQDLILGDGDDGQGQGEAAMAHKPKPPAGPR